MTAFVLIIFVILCDKWTLAEEGAKLSLLAKEDKVYCTAEHSGSGNLPTPAVVLQTSNLSDIVQTESKWVDNTSLVYDLIYQKTIGNWHTNGWWKEECVFYTTDILPLLDYHWEDFPIHDELAETTLIGSIWDVTISIRARESVTMTLADADSLTYYNITLGASEKGRQTHSVSVCSPGSVDSRQCHQEAVTQRILLDGSEWIHVTLAMRHSVLQLKLIETNMKAVPFLEVQSTKNFMYVLTARGNYSPAQFRIHKYNALHSRYIAWWGTYMIESPEFKPTHYPLCLSVLSLLWPENKKFHLRVTIVHNGKEEDMMTIHPLEEVAWQEVKGIYTLKSRNSTVRIRIWTRGTGSCLIGSIRECNPMGDVHVISMSTESRERSTFSCAFLDTQKKTVSKTSVTNIKSECKRLKKCPQYATTCNKFFLTESNCTDALLCERTFACCCQPEYVKPCIYEDFEGAVNLTVASVGEGPNNDCIITHWPDPCFAKDFILKSKIKRYGIWKETEEFSVTRNQSLLWDNFLDYHWCDRLEDETYMFEINYITRIPYLGERHHHAEVIASLSDTGVPDPPLELTVKNVTASSIYLTWLLPLRPNGKLHYFEIEAKPERTYLKYPTELKYVNLNYFITSYSRKYSYLLTALSPSTHYEISVRAHNIHAGQAATVNTSTLLAKPNIGPEFMTFLNFSLIGTSVIIQLPYFDRSLTSQSAYFLVGTSKSTVIEKLENVSLKNELLRKVNIKNENMSWFAAELDLSPYWSRMFIVGDNSCTVGSLGSYWNRPLNPGIDVNISLVAINQHQNNFEYEIKSLNMKSNQILHTSNTSYILTVAYIIFVVILICNIIFNLKRKNSCAPYSEETSEMELENRSEAVSTCP